MTRLACSVFVVALMVVSSVNAQTFGLGCEPVQVVERNSESFGLGGQSQVVQAPIERAAPIKVAPPVWTRTKIVDRSRSTWTDPAIGSWTAGKLTAHLRGKLGEATHRGVVPASELTGRTLDELLVMHANLHEGWSWDGSPLILDSPPKPVAVKPQVVYRQTSNCPGGVCPTNTTFRGRLFRWR